MAAPVVSGVAALVLSAKPSLTPDQVASVLRGTATPFPA
ncbi:MAG: S8 family serine peptidase [Rubrivivax sp.]